MKKFSWRTVALLRFIERHDVQIAHLRRADNRYLLPLIRENLVERNGTKIRITKEGYDYVTSYGSAIMTKRKTEGPISESAAALLRVSNLSIIRKKRA